MNKFIFIFGLLFLSAMVSAGTQDVSFKIKLEYIPNPLTTCVNVFDNSTNITWNNCSTINNGQIRIIGGEDETHVGITEYLADIISTRIYTGYKTADLGNLSDITGINDKLEYFTDCNTKLNDCMDSNREVSTQLILLEEDSGLKANFTTCSASLIKSDTNLQIKDGELKSKTDKIEELEGNKFMWILLGAAIGAIIIVVVIPKIKGTDIPKGSISSDLPPNPGYS